MTRADRMNEIFNSDKSDEHKIIAYQQIVIEELNEQVFRANALLVAALNKKIEQVVVQ